MKKNVLWNTIGTVFYFFCQWILTVVVVRMMNDYNMTGYFQLAMTMSSSYSTIALFNMRSFQASDVILEFKDGTYKGSRLLTTFVAVVCCFVAAIISKNSLYQIECIMAFMGIRVVEALVDVFHGMDQRYERYDLIGISFIIRGFLTIVLFVGGVYFTQNLLISLLLVFVSNALVVWLFDNNKLKKISDSFALDISKTTLVLLKKCAPFVLITYLLSQENLLPKQFLQNTFGADQQGIYSTIAAPALIVQVCAAVVFSPFLPVFSSVYQEKNMKAFQKMLNKLYLAIVVGSILVTLGAMLLGRWGLSLLYGTEILNHYYLFLPVVWVTILTAVAWIFVAILTAMRKVVVLLTGMIIDFLVCIALINPIVTHYEKNGVSIVQIIALAIYIIYMIAACEIYTFKYRDESVVK